MGGGCAFSIDCTSEAGCQVETIIAWTTFILATELHVPRQSCDIHLVFRHKSQLSSLLLSTLYTLLHAKSRSKGTYMYQASFGTHFYHYYTGPNKRGHTEIYRRSIYQVNTARGSLEEDQEAPGYSPEGTRPKKLRKVTTILLSKTARSLALSLTTDIPGVFCQYSMLIFRQKALLRSIFRILLLMSTVPCHDFIHTRVF